MFQVRTFTRYFDAFATPDNGVGGTEAEATAMIENWFLFCIIWGVGGSLDSEGRKKFDGLMREMDARFPPSDTVFEYVVDPKTKAWVSWDSRMNTSFRCDPCTPAVHVLCRSVVTFDL